MPNLTVVSPAAAVPADRLNLDATPVRIDSAVALTSSVPTGSVIVWCMAEDS